MDVVAFGENSLDLTSAAVGLARLGWRAKYVGRFGDDGFGLIGRQSLSDEGVDIRDIIVVPGVTSRVAVVFLERASGNRTVLWNRDVAFALQPQDISVQVIANARWLLEPAGPDLAQLLRYANAVAALNCGGHGARSAAPRRSDVEPFNF
ncbi:MAG: hypothetical protein H0T71_03415 [Acidobacteria bacterium]|nr:hypothetical protein [Acidobacteriota bacterium]